jgi:hypothetical protein
MQLPPSGCLLLEESVALFSLLTEKLLAYIFFGLVIKQSLRLYLPPLHRFLLRIMKYWTEDYIKIVGY